MPCSVGLEGQSVMTYLCTLPCMGLNIYLPCVSADMQDMFAMPNDFHAVRMSREVYTSCAVDPGQ